MAAVQIGLGARSTATDRASKIDDHIMYGKSSAIITIKIRNRVNPEEAKMPPAARPDDDEDEEEDLDDDEDESASVSRKKGTPETAIESPGSEPTDSSTYKHNVYGDFIIVERTLKKGGASTWNVKNHRGKSVKDQLKGITVRREVQNICDHFGFMVDNPVAVLTQTTSKKFLAGSNPSSHHELFCKATLLGPLAEELIATERVCEQIKLMIRQKEENLPIVDKQIMDLRVAYEESKEMKTMGDRIRDMEGVYSWTVADEEEQKLLLFKETTANDFEPELRALEEKNDRLRKTVDEANAVAAAGEGELNDVRARLDEARKAMEGATKQHKMRSLELRRKQDDVQTYVKSIRDHEKSVSDAEQRLVAARNAHLGGQAHKGNLASELSTCSADLETAEADVSCAEEALSVAEESVRRASSELPRLQQNLTHVANAHDNKRRQAAEQRQFLGRENHVGRFGSQFTKVMPVIDRYMRQGKFHFPPLGPVGQYLTVKDDRWAATIQDAIHPSNLMTFLVGDRHDMDLLRKIFSESRAGSPKVIVVSGGLGGRRHSIPPGEIPRVHELGHCTVMDQLDVASDDVFNMLVDHCQVEGNVLIQGEKAMIEVSRNRSLRNVRTCWDEFGNRAYERNRSHTFRPTERNGRSGSVLSSDREAHVLALENDSNQLMEQRHAAEEEVNNLKGHVMQLGQAERQAVANLKHLRKKSESLVSHKLELEEKIAEAASEFDARPFEEEIETCKSYFQEAIAEKTTAEECVGSLADLVQAADATRATSKGNFDQLRSEAKEKSASLEDAGRTIGKKKAAIRRITPEISKAKEKVSKAHEEISEQQGRYTKAMEDARLLRPDRPDMDDGKKAEKIEQELKSMRRKLQHEEERRDGKSAEDIEDEFLKAHKKFIENKNLMSRISSYHKSLKKGLDRRRKEKANLEMVIKRIVRTNFNLFLGTRGHRGRISFRKNERNVNELVISTQMATHKTGDGDLFKTKDLRSLSGGERSYTTLSFMLALAEVCQNPVRIMDEPDVFMDEASRNAAFRSLIEFCSSVLSDRQIVLVTPLTLPAGVSPSESVRIVKLRAVSRRGVTSNGGNQARMDDYLGGGQ